MMSSNQVRFGNEIQKELTNVLRHIGQRHGLWQAFRDFVAMSALAISNAVDKNHYDVREADYMRIVGRYSKEEANCMAQGLGLVVEGLSDGHCDFLGSLFMGLELGDSWKGQFFTPYDICVLMAKLSMTGAAQTAIRQKGFVSVNDPCVGAGAMVIAAAHAMFDEDLNYQTQMHAIVQDIDIVAVHMSYIQFSLLHIPALVYHANSLSMEVWSEWRTPAHVLGRWDHKLKREQEGRAMAYELDVLTRTPVAQDEEETSSVTPVLAMPLLSVPAINLREQMALFD
jgi:hypothetical protein